MSVPCLTYRCTACDFRAWDAGLVGARSYRNGREEVWLRVRAGWCFACGRIATMERFPDAEEAAEVAELEAALLPLLAEREALAARRRATPWWAFWRRRRFAEPGRLRWEIDHHSAALRERRERRSFLAARSSGPRCLHCGSEECVALPKPPVVEKFAPADTRPRLLGFVHPGCGGEITVASEGVRFNFGRMAPKFYDLEGRRIEEEEASESA